MPLIDLTVKCAKCGSTLYVPIKGTEGGAWLLNVEPCSKCLSDEYLKGVKMPETPVGATKD